MATFTRFALPLIALCLAVPACSAASDATSQDAPAAEQAQAAAPKREHGPLGAFDAHLAKIDLRPEQRQTIDAIRADLKAKAEPVHAARRELALAVANGVAAGNLSEESLAAPKARVAQAAEAFAPALQAAMNKLHATLDPAQRTALVESMRADMQAKHGKRHHGGRHGEMKHLAAQLDLTQEQLATLREGKHEGRGEGKAHGKMGEERGRMRAIEDAFEGESFDAASAGVGKGLGERATMHATRSARLYDKLLPTLTAEQRDKLASIVRERAASKDMHAVD